MLHFCTFVQQYPTKDNNLLIFKCKEVTAIHDCVIAGNALQAPLCKKKQLLFNEENDTVKIKMDCIWGYENCLPSFSKFIFLALQL